MNSLSVSKRQSLPNGTRVAKCPEIQGLYRLLLRARFLKYWRITGRSEAFKAQVVNYADDFVILSRGHATEALNWTRQVMPPGSV